MTYSRNVNIACMTTIQKVIKRKSTDSDGDWIFRTNTVTIKTGLNKRVDPDQMQQNGENGM